MEEWLASVDVEDDGEQGEVVRDRLGLVEGRRSSFEKFDWEPMTVHNRVEGEASEDCKKGLDM
jgi:hypothetical protein